MRSVLAIALVGLLAAGCNTPAGPDPAQEVTVTSPPVPPPQYEANVVVTQETPTGAPMRVQVQGIPLRADGTLGEVLQRGTDEAGAARFSLREPTTLLVRVLPPAGWTSEGARVHIGEAVAAQGLTVSDRDVFLPLYRDTLVFLGQHAWSTATAQPQPGAGFAPAVAVQQLAFPEGLQAAYLSRLADARVLATWTDTEQGRALNASVGLAWDGDVWVEGSGAPLTQTGARQAEWDGDLPTDRPGDPAAASLQAAILTRTAIVGEVLFDIETTLRFGGRMPAEMPPDECHGLLLC